MRGPCTKFILPPTRRGKNLGWRRLNRGPPIPRPFAESILSKVEVLRACTELAEVVTGCRRLLAQSRGLQQNDPWAGGWDKEPLSHSSLAVPRATGTLMDENRHGTGARRAPLRRLKPSSRDTTGGQPLFIPMTESPVRPYDLGRYPRWQAVFKVITEGLSTSFPRYVPMPNRDYSGRTGV